MKSVFKELRVPDISEVSNVSSVNILGRRGAACEAYQPATGLDSAQIGNIQRYLDAVRSNLLFAKSIVLVEGDAEEILIPILFKKVLGLSLDELGVSLINIRSTGFQNVAILFHETRIKKRCSIITDHDLAFIDTTPNAGDPPALAKYKADCLASQVAGVGRRAALDLFAHGNPWVSPHYAEHTFEVDFIAAGNAAKVASVVPLVYSQAATIATANAELASGNKALFGKRVLTMAANQGKGWFAILLGRHIDHTTMIPAYIRDALLFARQSFTAELIFNIYSYRVRCALSSGSVPLAVANVARQRLDDYRKGLMPLAALKLEMGLALPGDQIHAIFATVQ